MFLRSTNLDSFRNCKRMFSSASRDLFKITRTPGKRVRAFSGDRESDSRQNLYFFRLSVSAVRKAFTQGCLYKVSTAETDVPRRKYNRGLELCLDPKMEDHFPHFGTLAIHSGQEPEQWNSRAVVPPISMATTFKQDSPGVHFGFDYSRSGNPTRHCFEACVAALEDAKHGIATASGLSATMLLTHLLKSGDHLLCVDDVYGGTNRFFSKVAATQMGIEVEYVDATDLTKLQDAIKPTTKMVWIETPTNPLLKLVDIKRAADIVNQYEGVILVVDNTFMSSYFQRPLSLGADVVMHSVTKYMNGHSDTVMGVIGTNNDEIGNRLRFLQNAIGPVPSPFDCFLANRGLKTLHLRMKQHQANAMAVAKFLEKNPRVEKVIYPGLECHPQHELAKKQMKGFGGMVTFFIKGDIENAKLFFKSSELFTLAESLGGFESLAELPAIMTHASVPKEQRIQLGISDTLIRLSVGLEEIEDIIDDLDMALKKAVPESLLQS